MRNKKHKLFTFIAIFFLSYTLLCLFPSSSVNAISKVDEDKVKERVAYILNQRNAAIISGTLDKLPELFDTSQKYGIWALEHEVKRIKYLNDWSYQRGMKFTNINSAMKVRKISSSKNGTKIIFDEIYKFDYVYDKDENPVTNSFGVTLNHTMVLTNKNDNLIVYNDWYLDCFEDALKAYSGEIKNMDRNKTNPKPIFSLGNCPKTDYGSSTGRYNRLKAVEYADKYCGVSWGSGNELSHNKKYRNYTGAGGDCTNYASQVLGDKEAGGLRQDGTWRCSYHIYGNSEGSQAWVNADSFRHYLLYSGKGSLIKKGTFKDVTSGVPGYPCGYVQKLELGDLICYAKGNNIDHFSVITGWDSHGYPLVNSHTISRYHVPWDLGWGDNKIYFHLIHIR